MAAAVTYLTLGDEIVYENRGGVERDYVRDPLGNTIALLDNAQTQADTFTYWPYGELNARTGTTATPFQFVGTLGYSLGPPSNLTYVRARSLVAPLARWLTRDPAWPHESAYGYCRNRPAEVADPSGQIPYGPTILAITGTHTGEYSPPWVPCIYGNWCGGCNGPEDPIDDLDKCCKAHDTCLATFADVANPVHRYVCQCALCGCALRANCHWGFGCNIARALIARWSCGDCDFQII